MTVGLIATGDIGERAMLIAATGDLREEVTDDGAAILRESLGLATRAYMLADQKGRLVRFEVLGRENEIGCADLAFDESSQGRE
jgi:hypothetical protein